MPGPGGHGGGPGGHHGGPGGHHGPMGGHGRGPGGPRGHHGPMGGPPPPPRHHYGWGWGGGGPMRPYRSGCLGGFLALVLSCGGLFTFMVVSIIHMF